MAVSVLAELGVKFKRILQQITRIIQASAMPLKYLLSQGSSKDNFADTCEALPFPSKSCF